MLPSFSVMPEEAYKVCALGTESDSVLYGTCHLLSCITSVTILRIYVCDVSPVTPQLFVIESILVLRVWAIMGKRRRILWTFFGLLACTTAVSIVLNLSFLVDTLNMPTPSLRYV